MAELATIARPYAEALLKAGVDKSLDLQAESTWVDELASIASDSRLLEFAARPTVTPQQVFDLVSGLTTHVLPDAGKNFLRTLIDNGRLSALPEIAAQFRVLLNNQRGASDATVYSAFPIEGVALSELSSVLEKRFGRALHVAVVQDASLIGGIRVAVGDEVLDTSVKARLEQMKAALTA